MEAFDKQCKISSKGVGEYFISLFDMPTSPRTHGKLAKEHLPHKENSYFIWESDKVAFDKEENEVLQWLYHDEDDTSNTLVERIQHVNIQTEQYGKGFEIMQKMGYKGRGPLGQRNRCLLEPIKPS